MSDFVCATAARVPLASGQAAQINNINRCTSNISNNCTSSEFDLVDEAFAALFQNVKTCQYFNFNPSSFPTDVDKNKLFLLHLNIRSLSKNYDNLIEFLSNLSLPPHIISITETKIKDKPSVNIGIPGYTFLHVNSISNAGGVGVYVSDLLQFKELSFVATFPGCESLWIKITCPNTDINYVVGTVYRHPNTNANKFCEFLNEILTELSISHEQYFILGDMNLNTNSESLCNCGKDYLNMLSTNCSTNIIDKPTSD